MWVNRFPLAVELRLVVEPLSILSGDWIQRVPGGPSNPRTPNMKHQPKSGVIDWDGGKTVPLGWEDQQLQHWKVLMIDEHGFHTYSFWWSHRKVTIKNIRSNISVGKTLTEHLMFPRSLLFLTICLYPYYAYPKCWYHPMTKRSDIQVRMILWVSISVLNPERLAYHKGWWGSFANNTAKCGN